MRRSAAAAILVAAFIAPTAARAQAGVIAKWSYIPPFIDMGSIGEKAGRRIHLKWTCGAPKTATDLPQGTAIVRQDEVNGKTIQYQATITAADRKLVRGDTAVDEHMSRFWGTLFIDKKAPNRLRVNPYLWKEVPKELRCPPLPGDTNSMGDAERLRDVEFYYDLANRQTVAFHTVSLGFSGVAVPIRYRPGYTAEDNKAEIPGNVADPISIGALFGASYSRMRYQYVRNAENPLMESSRWTFGLFSSLGKGTVNAASSKSAATAVTVESSFPTLSIGPALMANVRGVDLGLFAAPEFALGGGDAKRWDFHGRWWWGAGLSFSTGK
jgi:hypothetical protein